MKRRLALCLAAVVLASACGGGAGAGQVELVVAHVPRASAPPAEAATAASAVDAFGVTLYARLSSSSGNLVFSPASVALALAMARAGAAGTTAAQMDAVMHGAGSDGLASAMNALDAALASRSGTFPDAEGHDMTVTLRIANAPFAQRGMSLVPAYLDALASRYGAGLQTVDYRRNADGARRLINAWVGQQTEGKIPELLAPGLLDAMVRLVLVNAIYLKAPWQTPFEPDLTAPAPFTRADGTSVDVPMMHGGGDLPYAEGPGWRAVELPYVGGQLALDIIVPDELPAFESTFTPDVLAAIAGSLQDRQVELGLPRFSVRTQAELAPVLSALGMPAAFDPATADFSGITRDERLFISNVIHEATIDVDEKGTEAAAATAVVLRATAMPAEPVRLTVDRPFVFALRDRETGAVLFMGRVVDPTAGG